MQCKGRLVRLLAFIFSITGTQYNQTRLCQCNALVGGLVFICLCYIYLSLNKLYYTKGIFLF